jgi:hypothetical protein
MPSAIQIWRTLIISSLFTHSAGKLSILYAHGKFSEGGGPMQVQCEQGTAT